MSALPEEDLRPALLDLQMYLREWRRWTRGWRPDDLDYPHEANFVRLMVPIVSGWAHPEDSDETITGHVMRVLDSEIDRLDGKKRSVLRLVYLNEILPAVFRSARWTQQAVRQICAEAEIELVPKLRAKGVVLGGR